MIDKRAATLMTKPRLMSYGTIEYWFVCSSLRVFEWTLLTCIKQMKGWICLITLIFLPLQADPCLSCRWRVIFHSASSDEALKSKGAMLKARAGEIWSKRLVLQNSNHSKIRISYEELIIRWFSSQPCCFFEEHGETIPSYMIRSDN